MSENPYQSPAATDQRRQRPAADVDPVRQKVQLRIPAVAILVLSAVACAIDVAILIRLAFQAQEMYHDPEAGPGVIAVVVMLYAFFLLLHATAFWGALNMLRMRGYSVARLSAVIASTAIVLVVSMPFGIWALVLLLRDDVKSCFSGAAPGATSD